MNTQLLKDTLAQSQAGQIPFPEVVRRLVGEGLESYRVDLVRGEDTFYHPEGSTHVEPMHSVRLPIAGDFSASRVVEAIRGSQTKQLRYPEFLERLAEAGCTNYVVYLAGQRCIYFGRRGDFHVEYFPGSRD